MTKWNEIAVNTVNAQPPIASAPPAGSVFVAMAQGAVYGAVNAIDRHGKPYLVINRHFPKASMEAAAATAAFRVLRLLVPDAPRDAAAAYERVARRRFRTGRGRTGHAVGKKAAAKMLAEGHDGRAVIGCTFGSGLPGVWQPLADPLGNAGLRPERVGGERQAVRGEERLAVSDRGPTAARKCCLRG